MEVREMGVLHTKWPHCTALNEVKSPNQGCSHDFTKVMSPE